MDQKFVVLGNLVGRRNDPQQIGSASTIQVNQTKPSLSVTLRDDITMRVKKSLVNNSTALSYGHNHIRDGSSRNFLDLAHEGPIPIAETLLQNEEEVNEVKECRKPAKCCDVRNDLIHNAYQLFFFPCILDAYVTHLRNRAARFYKLL
jgi:hypothetical protein